jgi:hypothetical protein
MYSAVLSILALLFALRPTFAFETADSVAVKTTLCEIVKHPETFDGKTVQVHALVESGLQDLPAAVSDQSCGAELKFYMPDDAHLAHLVKSKGFQKLIKDVKRNPVVEATVTGLFKRSLPSQNNEPGLALESVSDIVVRPQPHVKRQNL